MAVPNKALVLDLIEWIDAQPRTYRLVMEAWSTSCPRLPIWEDTVDLGFVVSELSDDSEIMVRLTDAGRVFLDRERLPQPNTTRAL